MKKLSFKLIIGLSILAIIVATIVTFNLKENKYSGLIIKPSYTAISDVCLDSAGALMRITNPKYTSEIVNSSDIIVKGQIISVNSETKTFKMQEGTPEKALADIRGSSPIYYVTGTNYTIKVFDIIKGNNITEDIVLYIPNVYKELVPELLDKDSFVFCLNWNDNLGKYIYGHPSASFFKVDKNENVKPVYNQTSDFYNLTEYNKLKSKFLEEVAAEKK